MQANEFEKNVQRAMDEFKLRPSDEVWQKVEERIQEKKKKRRILFFILFSFIGLALAGYGIYYFSNKQIKKQNDAIAIEKINNPKNNENKTTSIQPEKTDETNKSKGQKNLANKNNEKRDKDFNSDSTNSIAKNENILSGDEPQLLTDTLNQKMITDSAIKEFALNNFADSVSIKPIKNKEEGIDKKEKTRNQTSNRLQWGINVTAGSSVITEDRFSFKNTSAQADLSYNSPGSFPGGGGLTRYPPSPNRTVFAFKAGVVIKKDISLRSKISVGFQYAYLGDRITAATTQTQTGAQQSNSSSSLFSYYRAVPQKAHTDRFHFIELPLIYSWRINNDSKHFLSLNAGASFGYLVATNALIYDTSFGGIYFHDKSLFTRTHINIISGISYHFAVAKKFEWSIGPQFYFDVSKIIKSDIDKRKYFLFGGIDTRIFFEKKKKK